MKISSSLTVLHLVTVLFNLSHKTKIHVSVYAINAAHRFYYCTPFLLSATKMFFKNEAKAMPMFDLLIISGQNLSALLF